MTGLRQLWVNALFPRDASRRAPPAGAGTAPARPGVEAGLEELLQLRSQAAELRLPQRRLITVAPGRRAARRRSRGVDYLESRHYQPGDDIRSMDWRVTARTGRPHTKLYREERERPVILLVDMGPGMFFGTRLALKTVIAARAAALLAWTAVDHGDRCGLLLFGQDRPQELRPRGGRQGAVDVIQALAAWTRFTPDRTRGAGQPLSAVLGRLRRLASPDSLIVILSDFYSLDPACEQSLQRLRRRHKIIAWRILDGLETTPPPPGRYGVTDDWRTGVLPIGSSREQDDYALCLANHHAEIRRRLQRCAVPLLRLYTHEDVATGLRRGLLAASGFLAAEFGLIL